LLRLPVPIFWTKSQAGEYRANLRLDRVAVVHTKFVLDCVIPLRNVVVLRRGMVHLGHAIHELLELTLHVAQVLEHRRALCKHGATREGQAILRQVAKGEPFCNTHVAVIERLQSAQNLQQRGFPSPVRAHKPQPVARRDQQISTLEQQFVPVAFSGRVELDHENSCWLLAVGRWPKANLARSSRWGMPASIFSCRHVGTTALGCPGERSSQSDSMQHAYPS